MGVSVYYRGSLAPDKTVDGLVAYVKELARNQHHSYRTMEFLQSEVSDTYPWTFRFDIPRVAIENPDARFQEDTYRSSVLRWASEARLPIQGLTHSQICTALNEQVYRPAGIDLTVAKAELLQFYFVEGQPDLCALTNEVLEAGRFTLQRVVFKRSLALNTGYEYDPAGHKSVIGILNAVSTRFFGGLMSIREDN